MAKKKPKNARRTTDRVSGPTPVSPRHKPTGKKDPGGFSSPGFKSDGFKAGGKKKPRSGQAPPGVLEKERKGGPPSKRPSSPGKKKPPKIGWGGGAPDMPDWVQKPPRQGRPKPRPTPKPGPRKPGSAKPRPGPRKPSKGRPKKPMGKGRAK